MQTFSKIALMLLTQKEIDQIKSEVKAAAEPLMTGWATLDGGTAIKSFSPDMVSCYDRLLLDYQSFKESWTTYAEARESIKITPITEDYIILTKDFVIDTWVGKVEELMKSGEKVTYNPIRYTNVFRKSNGQWKIVFAQSSGIPVIVAPEK
ncbi:MAG: nuclear transport factor 2 family protein [Bacteroidia bacterium]|nr:nuclear transport factor 2 family protein [Bacteroidia bacterium]